MNSESKSISALFNLNGSEFYRIQGLDKEVSSSRQLFFAGSNLPSKVFNDKAINLDKNEWIATGTLRNSLYLEPIIQFTTIKDLHLIVEFSGEIKIKIFISTPEIALDTLKDLTFSAVEPQPVHIDLGSITSYPSNSRIFWHIDCLANNTFLYDVSYCTRSIPHTTKLAVLLRTYGRTDDITALLTQFTNISITNPYYSDLLDYMEFLVLDTSIDVSSKAYSQDFSELLNIKVYKGPNLGGGGNAGHLIKLFNDVEDSSFTEVLILDDDLSVSYESIARYFMFVAYRNQEYICSLPILMKSRPTILWEDGGFWGRLNFHEGGNYSTERNLFPCLLKHGLSLQDYSNLNDFNYLNICEYSTFIFFGLSVKTLNKLGYPASFFLRGDDIELSLRANKNNITLFTNPNLIAWHEPAHSYAQEYMAILHGIIINLSYSSSSKDFYTRFFEERLHEHGSIRDINGLKIYSLILKELIDEDSTVLTENFATHYINTIKELGKIKFTRISDKERDLFEVKARENNIFLAPFVYPGYHKNSKFNKDIVVINYSTKSYRSISIQSEVDSIDYLEICELYYKYLICFSKNFNEIQKRWQDKLNYTSTSEYWDIIKDQYKNETEILVDSKRNQQNIDKYISNKNKANLSYNASKRLDWLKTFIKGNTKSKTISDLKDLPSDFDPEYYLLVNSDVKASGLNPAEHYVRYGKKEGRVYKS